MRARPRVRRAGAEGHTPGGGERLAAGRFVALHLALLAAALAAFAWRMRHFAIDDFFITYRYAENLASGHGLRFNPDDVVFGTTAPGFALLLAALRWATGVAVPLLGTALTVVALLAVAAVVLRESAPARRGEAVLAVWLIGTSTFFWLHNGGELFAVAALLVTAGHLAARRPAWAGVLAGVAVCFRPDAGLGVAALAAWLGWRQRRLPHRFAWPAAAVIAAGLVAARLWFGRFLPATLEAKRWQVHWRPQVWPGGADFWPAFLETSARTIFHTALVPLLVAGAAGALIAFRRSGDGVRTLLLWAAATVVAYPLLGVAVYPWYGIPLLLALMVGYAYAAGAAGRAAFAFFQGAPGGRRSAVAVAAGLLVAALVAAPMVRLTVLRAAPLLRAGIQPVRFDLYRRSGLWLARNVPPDSRIAALEVGTVGFYSRLHVHDLLGLVSPEALPALADGGLEASFRAGRPDLLLAYSPQAAFLDPILRAPGFAAAWSELARFDSGGQSVVVYRRRPTADPRAGGEAATADVLRSAQTPTPRSQEAR